MTNDNMIKDKKKEIDELFTTRSNRWDKQIAFSPKEVSIMLNIPLSSITKLCRERKLVVFKVGRHYRIRRADLFNYIEEQIDNCIIL